LNQTQSEGSWFSRAKAEAAKGVPKNERVTGVFLVIASVLAILYFAFHQMGSTGFLTLKFGTLEMFLLYGSLVAWIITGSLDGIFGQRLLSRLFDTFGGIIFIVVANAWLLVVFPFEFTYFAEMLPFSLRFILQWISNDIARVTMFLYTFTMGVAAVYSPIAYKFVKIKRPKPE
jgi:hypothetical protein